MTSKIRLFLIGSIVAGTLATPVALAQATTGNSPQTEESRAATTQSGERSAQTGAGKAEKLEEVTVYGKDFVIQQNLSGTKSDTPLIETPQSISIISRDPMDSWDAGKLTEALRYTPGVNSEAFGLEPRFTSLRLRGFTANTEGLFRDGLVLRNPLSIVSYNLEPYGADRVEVPRRRVRGCS